MSRLRVALVVAIAACGSDPTVTPDAPHAPSLVTVLDGVQPGAGVRVLFQQPDSTVAADVVTDAAGMRPRSSRPGASSRSSIRFQPPGFG